MSAGEARPSRRTHSDELAARAHEQRRAVRVVAGRSIDVADCFELLAMLGLDDAAGLPVTLPSARTWVETRPGV